MSGIFKSHTVNFLKFVLGLRRAETTLTANEHILLSDITRGKKTVVEVGVYEGATSVILRESMLDTGTLYLVDPYFIQVRLEKILGFSFTEHIAKKNISRLNSNVKLIKDISTNAVECIGTDRPDVIFIDAAHDYESVKNDFLTWSKTLAPDGILAFHDSHLCDERPDLKKDDGPVQLINQISNGLYGDWIVCRYIDTISVVKMKQSINANV